MPILKRDSKDFFLHFGRAYPWRTASMVGLLVLSGLAEGVGVATLLPILEYGVAEQGEPSLLILDEATAALDPETKRRICRTIIKLKDHITILAIAHQSAMREFADVVYAVNASSARLLSEPVV